MPHYTSTGLLSKDHWKGIDRSSLSLNTLSNITGFPKASLKAWRTETSYCGLNYICLRQDANLLVYETCSDAELRGFARERKLNIRGEIRRAELIKLLQDKETFHGVLDLPAELRVRIYRHYFDFNLFSYDGVRVPPPITQVSRQLREETLEEIWTKQRFRFTIQLQHIEWLTANLYRITNPLQLAEDNVFPDVSQECLKHVSKLLVDVDDEEELWELDLGTDKKPSKVLRIQGKRSKIDGRLLKFLNAVAQRDEGEQTLRKGDKKSILKIFR